MLPWPIDGRRARRALTGAQVATLPCGHQAFAELPDEFTKILDGFLHEIDRRSI